MDLAKHEDEHWPAQQLQFAKALQDPSKEVPEFVTKTQGQVSQKRFNVYRNNIMVSLTQAILDAYPVTAELVGEEFATVMARVFVGEHLPKSPVMSEYGEGYGDFIKQFEPAASLPYLADIARLEWIWRQAYHSVDQMPLAISALSEFSENDLEKLSVEFCSSVHLLCSDYPIVSIWSAHQGHEHAPSLENIVHQGEHVLVNRPQWDVEVRTLTPGVFAFFSSLQAGEVLGLSIEKGNVVEGFDPAGAINALFETKCVAGLKIK